MKPTEAESERERESRNKKKRHRNEAMNMHMSIVRMRVGESADGCIKGDVNCTCTENKLVRISFYCANQKLFLP